MGNPTSIVYRSSWERKFIQWCDENPAIVQYASEEVVIPYISPIDNKQHRYFIDFFIAVRQKDGTIKKFLVEIKPFAQTITPVVKRLLTEKAKEQFKEQMKTYMVNQAKWEAAKKYCQMRGFEFCVVTERHLFKAKGKKK